MAPLRKILATMGLNRALSSRSITTTVTIFSVGTKITPLATEMVITPEKMLGRDADPDTKQLL